MGKIYTFILTCLAIFNLQAASDHFIVGTNSEFPPFSFLEDGKLTGFDIDIAKEVARRLDKEIEFRDMPFDALIPELALNRVDFVAAGISITEERAKRVNFTRSYLNDDPLVVFTVGSNKLRIDDLQGKNVVVVEGFTADLFMSDRHDCNLVRLPTQPDAFMAVKSGRADAFVTASTTARQFVENQQIHNYTTSVIPGTSETCALVAPKAKLELLQTLQNTLDVMRDDGTLQMIKKKWNVQ